ncbi:hypothetical protein C8F04DRAFT_1190630 [Mycena alexandri]|uniref:Retrotransposon gag domain-containing protein n=1 Tax=Mycena alexandri TaxID=1745969 RepID=A0AAD6SEQ6_9AGAR|nr:hypothetical protein C8F04DRAFT_1190630 [Mycena alexandri]
MTPSTAMSTPQEVDSLADRSESWRANPPHLPTNSAASTIFVSARTRANDEPQESSERNSSTHSASSDHRRETLVSNGPSPIPTGSPAPGTSSPYAPMLTARGVVRGSDGSYFLIQTDTGMRIDVIDNASLPLPEDLSRLRAEQVPTTDGDTPSDISDLEATNDSDEARPQPGRPLDDQIRTILDELGPNSLTVEQTATINQMRGALTTGRDRLLATTAMVIDNQQETLASHNTLLNFRDEVADRFARLHDVLKDNRATLNNCVTANVKALRDLGLSESLLGQILSSAAKARAQKTDKPKLPTFQLSAPDQLDPDIGAAANAILAPRRQGESLEEFGRRAESTLNRVERTAAAFAPPPCISSALHRKSSLKPLSSGTGLSQGGNSLSHTGYLTAADHSPEQGDIFEVFRHGTDKRIVDTVERALGEVLNLPSRIRSPKLDTPSKFSGTDDHLAYICWIETMVGWMRTMLYGGSDPDTDSFRVSVLKNLLDGVALEWYLDFVESAEPPMDFTGVLCGLHHRFITTATAHHALRDFDLIKYNSQDGPLKLMDDLETTSKRLREPMPDLIIRQRFMKLIPAWLHDDLAALHGISASYSSITQMRTHANQLWDAGKNTRGSGRMRAEPTHPRVEQTRPSAPNAALRRATTVDAKRPVGSMAPGISPKGAGAHNGPHSDKTCFKCGILGHIASDPVCTKYNEQPTFKERPRVGAQRGVIHDNWGGSQYDSEPEVVEEGNTDLSELTETHADEEARLGTMQFQYFTMRLLDAFPSWYNDDDPVTEDAVELMQALPRSIRPLRGFSHRVADDVSLINLNRTRQAMRVLRPEEVEQITQELRAAHYYRDDPVEQFAPLASVFKERHGGGTWPRAIADEWQALLRLQLAEHLCDVRLMTDYAPLALSRSYSLTQLALMNEDQLWALMTSERHTTEDLRTLRLNMMELNTRGRRTLAEIEAQLARPRGSSASTHSVLEAARHMIESTIEHTDRSVRGENDRLEARRDFMILLRYEHSLRPDLAPYLEGEVINPSEVPVITISDSKVYSSESDSDAIRSPSPSPSPPPEDGTPPPSYPGTPEPEELAVLMGSPSVAQDPSDDDDALWAAVESGIGNLSTGGVRLAAMRIEPEEETWDEVSDLEGRPGTQQADESTYLGPQVAVPHQDATPLLAPLSGPFSFYDERGGPETYARVAASMDIERDARTINSRTTFGSSLEEIGRRAREAVGDQEIWDNEDRYESPSPDEPTDDCGLWIRGIEFYRPSQTINVMDSDVEPSELTGPEPTPHELPVPGEATFGPMEYVLVDHSRAPLDPLPSDECILRSVVMVASDTAEQFLTFVD